MKAKKKPAARTGKGYVVSERITARSRGQPATKCQALGADYLQFGADGGEAVHS